MGDTSYSDMSAMDHRGDAVSEIQLLRNGDVFVHGQLEDCRKISYTLSSTPALSDLIGLHQNTVTKELKPLPSLTAAEQVT